MSKQKIKRLAKFPELKNLDSELDRIVKQIQEYIGLLDPALGEVYINDDPAVDIDAAAADTFYVLDSLRPGEKNKVEILKTGFRLKEAGTYDAIINCSFTCDVNNTLVHAGVFVNDVLVKKTQMHRKIGTAGDIGAMSMSGFPVGKESTLVQIKFTADKICTITVNHINFKILRVL